MTSPHEPVRLRFHGRMRRLPLMSFAAAFQRDIKTTARALDTLIQGPPENHAEAGPPEDAADNHRSGPLPAHGEGGKGGGVRSERSGTFDQDLESRSERERSAVGGASERAIADRLARALDDTENFAAILTLVRAYPEPLLDEALRRTLAVPADRIRGTRGAIFTGILRKLAGQPTP